jgi:hypothetical protein
MVGDSCFVKNHLWSLSSYKWTPKTKKKQVCLLLIHEDLFGHFTDPEIGYDFLAVV